MEYAPNGDLSRFIKKGAELNKAFPEEILWRYLHQIAQGLQQLHSRHILHRYDCSPRYPVHVSAKVHGEQVGSV
jgi:hypothetical protein